MMTRRDLLRYLLASPLAATLDLEKLLWVPTPRIVVPHARLTLDRMNEITCAVILPAVREALFAESPFYKRLQAQGVLRRGSVVRPIGQVFYYDGDGRPIREISLT